MSVQSSNLMLNNVPRIGRVDIMQILAEHQLVYLNRRKTEIEELKQSLAKNSFDLALQIGHRLKGNGVTFGFASISTLGIMMEKAAEEKDQSKLSQVINELEEIVNKALRALS
jgi:HPt (histidine-containing phosphotransfer) domain-containing protein